MIKQTILLLILALAGNTLFSQIKKEALVDILKDKHVGDTLVGKRAKYKLTKDDFDLFLILQNLENRDSVNLRKVRPEGTLDARKIPQISIDRQFAKIVSEFLTPEEKAIYKNFPAEGFLIFCRMEQGKIKELAFRFTDGLVPERDDPEFQNEQGRSWIAKCNMVRSIPVDRFYKIEKALIERIDYRGEEWLEGDAYLLVGIWEHDID